MMGCAGSAYSGVSGDLTGGGAASGCLTSACVPTLSSPVTWAIEIDPPSNAPGALTELPSVDIGIDPLSLTTDSESAVNAAFAAGAGATVPSTANVVLLVPPLIPGRPDLTFEAAAVSGSSTTTSATLLVPTGTIERAAMLELIPLAPSDQQSPPFSTPVTVATSVAEMLPTNASSISGTLLSAIGAAPTATFIARAFAGGMQVSNAPLTRADGTFQLLLAPTPAGVPVTVELTPQNQAGPDPWYTSSAVMPGTPLGTIMLPAYSNPNFFNVAVQGADDNSGVVGAFVRARAILASSASGATDYLRDGTTGASTPASATTTAMSGGTVTLSLLPGTATTALDYDLTVIPPASSSYATQCKSPVGVTVGGTLAAPQMLLTVALPRRPVLSGTVTSASGTAVGNVAIAATAGNAPTDSCASTPAVSSSTIADPNGRFSLPLDPGTYQLDYDPPAGSPVPRLTELAVTIPTGAGQITHDVTLPVPARLQGTVYAPGGLPLPSATVRIFEVRCSGQDDCFGSTRTPPGLLAQTVSDASGTFRAVVPAAGAGD